MTVSHLSVPRRWRAWTLGGPPSLPCARSFRHAASACRRPMGAADNVPSADGSRRNQWTQRRAPEARSAPVVLFSFIPISAASTLPAASAFLSACRLLLVRSVAGPSRLLARSWLLRVSMLSTFFLMVLSASDAAHAPVVVGFFCLGIPVLLGFAPPMCQLVSWVTWRSSRRSCPPHPCGKHCPQHARVRTQSWTARTWCLPTDAGAVPAESVGRGPDCAPEGAEGTEPGGRHPLSRGMTRPGGHDEALGSRLSALGSRLSALGYSVRRHHCQALS